MTDLFSRPAPWTRLVRSLRPTYGARCNAADGVADLRLDRAHRAQAAAAFDESAPGLRSPRPRSRPGR